MLVDVRFEFFLRDHELGDVLHDGEEAIEAFSLEKDVL